MSKPSGSKKSRRPDGKQKPKTRQQQQQEVNVYIYRRLDAMEKMVARMLQKMELVSALTQQMIVTLVLLNEKGLVTNEEVAARQKQFMLPVDEQFAGLQNKVEGGAGTVGEGTGETDGSNAEKTVDADSTNSDSDIDSGVSESDEVQSEDARSVESDSGLQEVRLSDGESEGSDRSCDDREITKQSDVSPSVSESTDSSSKTPHLSLD